MKLEIEPDATHRIVLTKEMRQAAGIHPGQPLEVSVQLGSIVITPKPVTSRIVKKGKFKVIDSPVKDLDLAEAVNAARHYIR